MKLKDFLTVCSDPYEIEDILIYSPDGEFLGRTLYNDDDYEMATMNRFGEADVVKYEVADRCLTCIAESLG